jgi:REP element-mobilizing transposase RayT
MTLYRDRYRVEPARLKGWDYASEGLYFVTICTHDRALLLGDAASGQVRLSEIGEEAARRWQDIPAHFPLSRLDEFVVMPNHLHGIVVVETCHGMFLPNPTTHGMSLQNQNPKPYRPNAFSQPNPGSLSMIVNHFKSAVTRFARQHGYRGPLWQTRFYDHIIRNPASLTRIQQYILDNPARWATDRNRLANLWI